jgi:hypothetical protein
MIKLIYSVKIEQRTSELEWLRVQKVFPAVEDYYDWASSSTMTKIGVVVTPDIATLIKLRHELDTQLQYNSNG